MATPLRLLGDVPFSLSMPRWIVSFDSAERFGLCGSRTDLQPRENAVSFDLHTAMTRFGAVFVVHNAFLLARDQLTASRKQSYPLLLPSMYMPQHPDANGIRPLYRGDVLAVITGMAATMSL